MCKKSIYLLCLLLVLSVPRQVMAEIKVAEELLVDLRAADLAYGSDTTTWVNRGTLDNFEAMGGAVVVEEVAGHKAVTFDGGSWFAGPTSTPGIEGGGTRSIEVWAYNLDIDAHETMVSWGHRGGPGGSNMAFTYGNNPNYGAVGHWGVDMGWSPVPEAGNWWHLVYTYDGSTSRLYVNAEENATRDLTLVTHGGGLIRVAAQAGNTGAEAADQWTFSGSIGAVRIHDGVLSPSDVAHNFRVGLTDPALASDPDPADGDTNVIRDVVLRWTPGESAPSIAGHKIYFGEDFNDVN